MVIPRPVSCLLVVEIHPLSDFIVSCIIFLTVIAVVYATCAAAWSGRGNEGQDRCGWRRPCRLRNHATRKHTLRRIGTPYKTVRLVHFYGPCRPDQPCG